MKEQINELVEELGRRVEKIGLYQRHVHITSGELDEETQAKLNADADLKGMIEAGEVELAVFAVYTVADLAFSDRVQDRKRFDADTEFKQIVPSTAEMKKQAIIDRLKAGKSIFDDEESDG